VTGERAPGLDEAGVAAARERFGRNEMPAAERRGPWRTLGSILAEPMFVLLLVAAGLYLALGDRAQGLLLAFFALVTVGLVVLQERRSERALDGLRALAAPRATAWRGGARIRLPAAELVPGDLVLLDEGERVPADGIVREGEALAIDESLLTGESGPVRKTVQPAGLPARDAAPGGDDRPVVFAGTLVLRGHALMEVLATGARTQVGRIGKALATIDSAPAPMALQLHRLVRWFAVGAVATSLALVAWYGLVRHEWLQGVLSGIALAMAMLPEEFPMALSIFMALGAWRLARARVLVRRPSAIDSLGATTLLCLDKTGTLTRNELRVEQLALPGGELAAGPDARHRPLLEAARRACRTDGADPLDRAVLALCGADAAPGDSRPLREYPLVPGRPLMAQAWSGAGGAVLTAAKGAPEAIVGLCRLDAAAERAALAAAAAMAGRGLRVIAVALAAGASAGERLEDQPFAFMGLLGFADPLRDGVPAAIAACRAAGIEVAMITGDHAATALAVAAQAGMATAGGALVGPDIARMDAARLAVAVRSARVFARVTPEQKLRLVQAFQAAGQVVAMTGDGVNDAPALKAAHVGIAMGLRGTDVAREAAQLVLLDEDVGHIVEAVALGRRIFDNLRKVMIYIVAIHVPIAGAALLPLLFGWPPLLLPVHVVLTEMVIDPMCSLVFENAPADPAAMRRPPRAAGRALVDARVLLRGILQGGVLLACVLGVYALALRAGLDVPAARALAILALTGGNVALVAVDAAAGLGWRGVARREFASFWVVAGLAACALALGMGLPAGRALLQFGQPGPGAVLLAAALVVGVAMVLARAQRETARRGA